MYSLDAETISYASAVAGVATSVGVFAWKKLIKPTIKFLGEYDDLKEAIETIRSEVVTNGGHSIKDSVNSLRVTCQGIEKSQIVLDQRSKASLHYHDRALFEIDKFGGMSWCNEKFEGLTENNTIPTKGFDWVSIVDEEKREEFVKEVTSCLEMCRKIDIETISIEGLVIHFVGHPYRITDKDHEGFLIHLYKGG